MNESKSKKKVQWNKAYACIAGICVLLFSGCRHEHKSLQYKQIISAQMVMYPAMEIQDWYKLLHQASMGNRHLGVDDSLIYAYLLGEWERIEASDNEPMVEYISPDSSVIRLNLRPFKASGGTPDEVFASMKKTWGSFAPSDTLLEVYLSQLQEASKQGLLVIPEEMVAQYIEENKRIQFPAVHHSENYEALYRPAYRVLERQFMP